MNENTKDSLVGNSTSDDESTEGSENHEALEVVFSTNSPLRRRASLTKSHKSRSRQDDTSCFVHALLEQRRHEGDSSPNTSDEPNISRLAEKTDRGEASEKTPQTPTYSHTQSRLLTKKQLSDMAFGIRELSSRLGRIRLRLKVRNVFLLTKAHDVQLIEKSREMAQWLLDNVNAQGVPYVVWVEDTLRNDQSFNAKGLIQGDKSRESRLQYWNNELCRRRPHSFDIVVALGGDGTVLYASSLFQRVVPPVLSFALGSLGFLTKFDFDVFPQTLDRAFDQGITISLRIRFEGTVMRSIPRESGHDKDRNLVTELIGSEADNAHTHKPASTFNILNEIVLDRGPNATMSSIEVFGDESHFTTVQADGICVATPTGSTAYNLAAGGSLCHPENPVILLTAICAHTLNFRPIILPDTIVLRVGVPFDARASSWASFDGRERTELHPGDYVTISASRFPYPSVLPLDRRSEDWIDSISRTLNWNSRQKQKAYSEDS